MARNRPDAARVREALADPESLLRLLDEEGVERAALINYVAPEVMGFVESANDWISAYTRNHRDRLLPVGSVHPRRTRDARGDARRLFDELGIRMLKIHPPHQLVAANAYRDGDEALRRRSTRRPRRPAAPS